MYRKMILKKVGFNMEIIKNIILQFDSNFKKMLTGEVK